MYMTVSTTRLLVLGVAFHVVYILSVFDCYFRSPVVHGMRRFAPEGAPAKRLVLFVADGLRADLFFNVNPFPKVEDSPRIVAPYLREVIEKRGSFGVSHTRVPTESRPGHVALIAGMYEDVSAVTRGWKTNPVDFDSVFNQSSATFSFGSPDILPMFARGASPGKVNTWSYDESEEDFTKDATALDVWVLDQLERLFHNATYDKGLDNALRGTRTVFFLHLLGLDTTGHSYRPHSPEYMRNIQVVDDIVAQTEVKLKAFYGEEESSHTSFVFTADHGMSNRGNHGDGDPDSTRTPLVVWGAGVRKPLSASKAPKNDHDGYSEPWHLSHLARQDVEQADVAAFMAALLGLHTPVHCVGTVPLSYLDTSEEFAARASSTNARAILEHFEVKSALRALRTVFYQPFEGMSMPDFPRQIDRLLERGDWHSVKAMAALATKDALEGIRYLDTYDRFFLRGIVAAGYLGWSAYVAALLLERHQRASTGSVDGTRLQTIFGSVAATFTAYLVAQGSPWTYYVYVACPFFFWYRVSQIMRLRLQSLRQLITLRSTIVLSLAIVTMECMVVGYTHRTVWSAGFASLGMLWPLTWPTHTGMPTFSWIFACLSTAVFPSLPAEKTERLRFIVAGSLAMFMFGSNSSAEISKGAPDQKRQTLRFVLMTQNGLTLLSLLSTASSVQSLQAKQGLPQIAQFANWMLLGLSVLLVILIPRSLTQGQYRARILSLFLAFCPCFVLLSISMEGLFYLSYFTTLTIWADVECALDGHRKARKPAGSLRLDDIRIALFFLFFVQAAFFGTGNVASISSFYLEPVYRLVPIFSPFLMASLLIFKIVAPYVVLSAVFSSLNQRLHLQPFSLFLVALTMTDVMTITFFFNVTDTGSWLEIGQSISFFCITSLLFAWSAGICAAGDWMMAGSVERL